MSGEGRAAKGWGWGKRNQPTESTTTTPKGVVGEGCYNQPNVNQNKSTTTPGDHPGEGAAGWWGKKGAVRREGNCSPHHHRTTANHQREGQGQRGKVQRNNRPGSGEGGGRGRGKGCKCREVGWVGAAAGKGAR